MFNYLMRTKFSAGEHRFAVEFFNMMSFEIELGKKTKSTNKRHESTSDTQKHLCAIIMSLPVRIRQ